MSEMLNARIEIYQKNIGNLEKAHKEAEVKYNKKFTRHRNKKVFRKVFLEDHPDKMYKSTEEILERGA